MQNDDDTAEKPDGHQEVSIETEQRAFAAFEQDVEASGVDVALEHGERWVGDEWEPVLRISISGDSQYPAQGEMQCSLALSEPDAERVAIRILDEIGGDRDA